MLSFWPIVDPQKIILPIHIEHSKKGLHLAAYCLKWTSTLASFQFRHREKSLPIYLPPMVDWCFFGPHTGCQQLPSSV